VKENNRQGHVGKEDDRSEQKFSRRLFFVISGQASYNIGQHWRVDGGYTYLDRAPT
jgi:hypothetical protein